MPTSGLAVTSIASPATVNARASPMRHSGFQPSSAFPGVGGASVALARTEIPGACLARGPGGAAPSRSAHSDRPLENTVTSPSPQAS